MSVLATVVGAHDENGHVPDDRVPLVGRLDELERLAGLVGLTAAEPEPASAVLLSGDAGVGKTRLLAELRDPRRGRRLAGAASGTASTSATARCPTCRSARPSAGSPPRRPPGRVPRRGRPRARAPDARAAGCIPEQRRARSDDTEPVDRAELFEAVARRARALGRADARCCSSSRTCTGPTSRPASCSASCSPGGFDRRSPSSRPTAATTCTAATRCAPPPPSGPGCPASAPRRSRRCPTPTSAPWSRSAAPGAADRARRARHRRARRGQRVLRRGARAAASRSAGALPADLADLLLVRLDQLDDAARQVVRAAAVPAAGCPTSCSRGSSRPATQPRHARCAPPSSSNVLVPVGPDGYAFRHALLAEAVYDDLLPGERVRLHARLRRRRCAARRRRHGGRAGPARPAAHDLATAVRGQHRRPATRRWPSADPTRPPGTTSSRSSWPTDSGRRTAIRRRPVDARPRRAPARRRWPPARPTARSRCVRDQLRSTCPRRRRRPDRPRLLARSRARSLIVVDTDVDALAVTTEALALVPDEPADAAARPDARAARARPRRAAPATTRRPAGPTEALELGRPARPARRRRRGAHHAGPAATSGAGDPARRSAMLEQSVAAGARRRRRGAELRGLFNLGRPALRGRSARRGPRGLRAAAPTRAEEVGRPWAPYGLDARVLRHPVAYVAGDWDGASALADVRDQSPPDLAEAMLAASGLLVARRARRRRGARAAARAAAAGGGATGWSRCSPARRDRPARRPRRPRRRPPGARRRRRDRRRLWENTDFQARIRLTGLLLGQLAPRRPSVGSDDRDDLAGRARPTWWTAADARRRCASSGVGDEGPEGRAWLARVRRRARPAALAGRRRPAGAGRARRRVGARR